jgi:hypothetical protein
MKLTSTHGSILAMLLGSVPFAIGCSGTGEGHGERISTSEAALSSVYEAEDGLFVGPIVSSTHAGFTGRGYLDYQKAGDFVEITVDVPTSGYYHLNFRHANGGTTNRPLRIEVNREVVHSALPFMPTGSWSTRANVSMTTFLGQGLNIIGAVSPGSSAPDLDHLKVTNVFDQTVEAESAARSPGVIVASSHLGYTGTGYVDFPNTSGAYAEWSVEVPATGTYRIGFRHANGGTATRKTSVAINGGAGVTLNLPRTGGWAQRTVVSTNVRLVAGSNRIRTTNVDSIGASDLDQLRITSEDSTSGWITDAGVSLQGGGYWIKRDISLAGRFQVDSPTRLYSAEAYLFAFAPNSAEKTIRFALYPGSAISHNAPKTNPIATRTVRVPPGITNEWVAAVDLNWQLSAGQYWLALESDDDIQVGLRQTEWTNLLEPLAVGSGNSWGVFDIGSGEGMGMRLRKSL